MSSDSLISLVLGIIQAILGSNIYKNHQDDLPIGLLFCNLSFFFIIGFIFYPIKNELLLLIYFVYFIVALFDASVKIEGEIAPVAHLIISLPISILIGRQLLGVIWSSVQQVLIFIVVLGLSICVILIPNVYILIHLLEKKVGKLDIAITMSSTCLTGLLIGQIIHSL